MELRKTLSVLVLFLASTSFGQFSQELGTTSKQRIELIAPSNIERYGIDYIVKNYDFNGDSTILESIDLNYMEQFRQADNDVELIDDNTGLTVVLFYRKRTKRLNTILEND